VRCSTACGPRSAWIETTLIQVLTDPERIAAMSARASAAAHLTRTSALARLVLTAVTERRRLVS
jgi:UDP-N-acetylglucosamine--N-acetylmuramyl-(pentapeptide) pyrophosphoryl-undecaprenol N-acetylglucosamine transferase